MRTMLLSAAILLVLGPFLLSGVTKALDFSGAIAEVRSLNLPWPMATAGGVVALQLGAPLAILLDYWAWAAALALAAFTVAATLMAHAFWSKAGAARARERDTFFEHLAIVGGLCFIILVDLGWLEALP